MNTLAQQVKDYLMNPNNPTRVKVQIKGEKRTIFVNNRNTDSCVFGLLYKRCRNKGYYFSLWDDIEKVFIPKQYKEEDKEKAELKKREKIIAKYQKLASTASFTNDFLRDVAKADPNKSMYENKLSTGVPIEGNVIKLSTIEKYACKREIEEYKQALKECKEYTSIRFRFQGYDGHLWVTVKDGEPTGGFSKEYKNCGNGYYYIAINDECFVGYDID